MSDILGVGNINGTTADPPAKPTASATNNSTTPATAAAPAKEISRSDLILLVQKLQKRSAAAEQQVTLLKKQIAEQATSPVHRNATPDPNNLVDLLSAPVASSSSTKEDSTDTAAQLSKQQAIHASQLANLQAELKSKNDAIESLNRTVSDARKELARARTASASPPAPAPSSTPPLPSASPSSAAAAQQQQQGGSFLLENANKELRLSLANEQSKVQAAEKRAAQLQAKLDKAESDLQTASKNASTQSEGVQKRLQELEAKLAMSDSKLMKSFALIEAEKKKTEAALGEGNVLKGKIKDLTQALEHSSSLLRESQGALQFEKQQSESLRTENVRLFSKVNEVHMEGESDGKEWKKMIQSKDECILGLQNELDHLRLIHARSIGGLEEELSRLTRQFETQLEQERVAMERVQTEGQQERHVLETETERARRDVQEMKSLVDQATNERIQAIEQFQAAKGELESIKTQYSLLQQKYDDTSNSHATQMKELEDSSREKYQRLLTELKAYRIHTIQTITTLQNDLSSAKNKIVELEEEIQHGKPNERRLWELVTLQSSRDEKIRELEAEMQAYKTENIQFKSKLEQFRIEKEFLTSELKNSQESKTRSSIDIDYLKSVLIEYIKSEGNHGKKVQLIPVLAQLLRFTKEDLEICKMSLNEADVSAGFWSKLTSLATAKTLLPNVVTGAGVDPKRKVILPPTIPIGVELEHLSSPFASVPPINTGTQQTQLPSAIASAGTVTNVDLTGAVAVQSP